MKKTLIAASAFAMLIAAPVFAQTAAPAPAATPATTAAPAAAAKPMGGAHTMPMPAADKKAKSAECSKEADAKGLHGKERKKFRETCKKG